MIIEREYLHLDEAERIPGISKFDIIEFIRNKQINAYAWHKRQIFFGVVKLEDLPKNSTIGSFEYEGIIKIPNVKATSAIDTQKEVSVIYCLIMETNHISNWKKDPPNIPFPNNEFSNHIPKSTPPLDPFWACSKIRTMKETMKSTMDFLYDGLKLLNDTKEEDALEAKKVLDKSLDEMNYKVGSPSIKIPVQNLRFRKSEVEKLFNKDISTTPPTHNTNKKSPTPIDLLIIDILENNDFNSGEIWIELQRESKKEIFDRKYDEYGILEEVSHERMYWKNTKGELKKLERSGFRKKISQVKSKYISSK